MMIYGMGGGGGGGGQAYQSLFFRMQGGMQHREGPDRTWGQG